MLQLTCSNIDFYLGNVLILRNALGKGVWQFVTIHYITKRICVTLGREVGGGIEKNVPLGDVHILRNAIFQLFRPPSPLLQNTVQIPMFLQWFVTNR